MILITDLTESYKAEEIYKKHFLLFEHAKDIILYIKSDGTLVDANKKAVEKYGYTREELLTMNLSQLRHPSAMKDYEKQLEMSRKGTIFETVHVKKDGTAFPVEVSSKTIMINGEEIRIGIIRDITERKQIEDKIRYLANYDSLTNIPNRGYIMEQLGLILERAKREKTHFAVMLLDIDKFKSINDRYGHNAGDCVLKTVAERMQAAVRKSDIIGRLGGDEFFAIQTSISSKDDMKYFAQRILEQVCQPVKWNGLFLDISISLGIATYPENGETPASLMQSADYAMYLAKGRGGCCYEIYEGTINRQTDPMLHNNGNC